MAVLAVRKFLILVHRYLGIVLSLVFVIWFASGIGMMYAGGMPTLTPQTRLERLDPLDLTVIKFAPDERGENVKLLTVMGHPAYQIDGLTVFADTGETLEFVDEAQAAIVAAHYMDVAQEKVRYLELLTEADQWTIGNRGDLPLHKIAIDDPGRTQLYISPINGEVVLMTTRGSRALAWVAAIPHWLYFRSLRVQDDVWRAVVVWLSGLGCILAFVGLLVGLVQFRRTSPHVPYGGWMRWHYLTGAFFGLVTLTWVFSGLLSMEPYDVFATTPVAMTADPFEAGLDISTFPVFDAVGLKNLLHPREVKEVEFLRMQGEPYYLARTAQERIIVDARAMKIRTDSFTMESLVKRIADVTPGTQILESQMLSDYDSYYYSRDRQAPLPVLRVKFDDPAKTWLYVDPQMSRIVTGLTRVNRVQRWIYTGFHDLDFAFWYNRRPLWDIGVITLSLGGLASSMIGLYLGFKRLIRGTQRLF
jgi:hypothetical protein